MSPDDSKAIAQFIKKAVNDEDIILKSEGNQFYSYSYVTDAISGIIYCLLLGKTGEAYNISDKASNITLKKLAEIAAKTNNKKVIFELPDAIERAGYSTATKAILNNNKIRKLGWEAKIPIKEGIIKTISIIKDTYS
jgi:nucleoside-diphosphate-sugar epimerase